MYSIKTALKTRKTSNSFYESIFLDKFYCRGWRYYQLSLANRPTDIPFEKYTALATECSPFWHR